MLNPVINFKASCISDFQELGERYMYSIELIYNRKSRSNLFGAIEQLLKEKQDDWFSKLLEYMRSDEYIELVGVDETLWLLKRMCQLCIEEYQAEENPMLCKFSSLKEMLNFYQKTVFLLRRIELCMPQEYCDEIIELIASGRVTAEYLIMVIENGNIWSKDLTAKKLSSILARGGYEKIGDKIWGWYEKQ